MQKKQKKKLTNVSLYVYMSAKNSEMIVFISVFFPTMRIFQIFNDRLGKNRKMLVFMVKVKIL